MTLAQADQILGRGGWFVPLPRAAIDKKSPSQIGLRQMCQLFFYKITILQNATILLQNATVITKCVLITKCVSILSLSELLKLEL